MKNVSLQKIEELLSSGSLDIPQVLLRLYSNLNINEEQLVIILQIKRFIEKENNYFPSIDEISELMSGNRETVKTNIALLMEKGILSIETNKKGESEYSLKGLYKKLAQELEKNNTEKSNDNLPMSETVKRVYPIFEKEFARPLSPMETSQLIEWSEGDGFSAELILEALKRSVLRGALNFRYIDTILRQWSKNGIYSAKEAYVFEEKNKERNKDKNVEKDKTAGKNSAKNTPDKKSSKGKYSDLYVNWGG